MKLTKLAVVLLLGVALVAGVITGCSSELEAEPVGECGKHPLSRSEAIALAQNEFEDALNSIPCADGRSYLMSFLQLLDYEWYTEIELLERPQEKDYRTVYYGNPDAEKQTPLTWHVYCKSRIASPVGNTWSNLQEYISISSRKCD